MALASHHMPFGPAGAAHGASVPNLVRTETKRLEDLKMRPPLEKERVSGQLSSNLALERLCGRARGPVSSAVFAGIFRCVRRGAPRTKVKGKGYGLKCPGWWECSLAAISQTTTHMHGHHEATMGLAGVSLGRELRALALSHTASVRRGTA